MRNASSYRSTVTGYNVRYMTVGHLRGSSVQSHAETRRFRPEIADEGSASTPESLVAQMVPGRLGQAPGDHLETWQSGRMH